jgi:hypothetical protein
LLFQIEEDGPGGSQFGCAAVIGFDIYFIGGEDNEVYDSYSSFNVVTKEWGYVPDMNHRR